MNLIDLYYQNEYDKLEHGQQLDKFDHLYLEKYYNKEFTPRREDDINLLEIGVATGVSIKFWTEWFTKGKIYGVDICHHSMNSDFYLKNKLYNVFWQDALTDNFISKFKNNFFDYVIDDGSHTLSDQLKAITNYLPKIKPNGKLIIEDIRSISYIPIIIDHIDKNPGNNKIENLRGVSHKANMLNRNPNKGKTLPTGICWDKRRKKYKVMIGGINIGRYDELSKAIEIANNVRNEMLNKLIDG